MVRSDKERKRGELTGTYLESHVQPHPCAVVRCQSATCWVARKEKSRPTPSLAAKVYKVTLFLVSVPPSEPRVRRLRVGSASSSRATSKLEGPCPGSETYVVQANQVLAK